MTTRRSELPARFTKGWIATRVAYVPGGCWEWAGARLPAGYGAVSFRDATGRMRGVPAHRLAYIVFTGDLSDGLQVDHLCHNRPCVNPAHLDAVTPLENARRACARRSKLEAV